MDDEMNKKLNKLSINGAKNTRRKLKVTLPEFKLEAEKEKAESNKSFKDYMNEDID